MTEKSLTYHSLVEELLRVRQEASKNDTMHIIMRETRFKILNEQESLFQEGRLNAITREFMGIPIKFAKIKEDFRVIIR